LNISKHTKLVRCRIGGLIKTKHTSLKSRVDFYGHLKLEQMAQEITSMKASGEFAQEGAEVEMTDRNIREGEKKCLPIFS